VPVYFARSLSLSHSVSRARFVSAEPLPLRAPFSLSAPWTLPVRFAFPTPAMDRRVRTRARRWVSRPRRPPMCPAPFLESRQCPVHTPHLISLGFTISRALPMPPAAAGDPRPCSRPSSSPETAPGLTELRPEMRHPSPCPISLIAPYIHPILPSSVLDRGVRRARAVAGRFSPVYFTEVVPCATPASAEVSQGLSVP
jgi:hypothetical protein